MSEVNHSLCIYVGSKMFMFYLEIQLIYVKLSTKLDLDTELLQKLGIRSSRQLSTFEPKNSAFTV